MSFANNGSEPLTISGTTDPSPPFSVSGAPATGDVLQPGDQVVADIGFAPTVNGEYSDNLIVASDGGTVDVAVTGSSDTPAYLQFSQVSLVYAPTPVGTSETQTFTLSNTGGSNLTSPSRNLRYSDRSPPPPPCRRARRSTRVTP